MKQNINLLSTLSLRPKQHLSPKALLLIITSFTGMLILIYGLAYIPLMKQKSSLAQLYTMRNDLNAQIKVVEQIKAKKTKTNIANNKPPQFSSYFVSLAEATPDSIWLTNIKFSNIDQTLSLGGYATNFIIIPYFLRNLSKLSDFPKGKISVLNFTKVDKGDAAGGISFQFGRT